MASDDNIIAFPGPGEEGRKDAEHAADEVSAAGTGAVGIPGLTADQEKAVQIVLSGMSFVCIGIKPAGDGADFFTAIHGKREDLLDAAPHLDGVIQRAFDKRDL